MKILIRLDLNVPIKDGIVKDRSRIDNYKAYINQLNKNNKLTIITHLGRPKGKQEELSTKKLINDLEKSWNKKIIFIESYNPKVIQDSLNKLSENEILLLENTRFFEFEKSNDKKAAKELAQSFDKFIFDAFSCSHRKHMSTNAITHFLPSEIGESCMLEINNLRQALTLENPLIIMGGAKALTKLELIETFINTSSNILVGGVLANTFLKAQGFNIQKSKYEPELIKLCKSILQSPNSQKIVLPTDFLVSTDLNSTEFRTTEILSENEMITDIGPKTTETFLKVIQNATNVIFNGPLGYIENPLFKKASVLVLNKISKVEKSYLGGGDTLKLMKLAKKQKKDFTFVSMAGGAMLEFLGKKGELEVINEILKGNI